MTQLLDKLVDCKSSVVLQLHPFLAYAVGCSERVEVTPAYEYCVFRSSSSQVETDTHRPTLLLNSIVITPYLQMYPISGHRLPREVRWEVAVLGIEGHFKDRDQPLTIVELTDEVFLRHGYAIKEIESLLTEGESCGWRRVESSSTSWKFLEVYDLPWPRIAEGEDCAVVRGSRWSRSTTSTTTPKNQHNYGQNDESVEVHDGSIRLWGITRKVA